MKPRQSPFIVSYVTGDVLSGGTRRRKVPRKTGNRSHVIPRDIRRPQLPGAPPPLILISGCICTGTVVNTYLGVFINGDGFKLGGGHHSALEESICGRQSPEQFQ